MSRPAGGSKGSGRCHRPESAAPAARLRPPAASRPCPARRDDPAYLGHLANDGSTCLAPARLEEYRREAAAAANAVPVWVKGCHLALQASRPIAEGEEVLYAYGEGWWLTRGGHEGVGTNIRVLGSGMAARKQSERLKSALRSSRGGAPGGPGAKGASGSSSGKASAKAKARKEEARGKKAAKKGFG